MHGPDVRAVDLHPLRELRDRAGHAVQLEPCARLEVLEHRCVVIADGQAKWMNFWSSTISAAQTNAAALAKVSSKAVDAWTDFIHKNTEVMEVRVPKSA